MEVTDQVETPSFCDEWAEFLTFGEERQADPPPETLTDLQLVHDRWRSLLDDAAEAAPPELDVPMETMQRLVDDATERKREEFGGDAVGSGLTLASAAGILAEATASRENIDEYYQANCPS